MKRRERYPRCWPANGSASRDHRRRPAAARIRHVLLRTSPHGSFQVSSTPLGRCFHRRLETFSITSSIPSACHHSERTAAIIRTPNWTHFSKSSASKWIGKNGRNYSRRFKKIVAEDGEPYINLWYVDNIAVHHRASPASPSIPPATSTSSPLSYPALTLPEYSSRVSRATRSRHADVFGFVGATRQSLFV